VASGNPDRDHPDLELASSQLNSGAIHLLRSLAAVDRQSGLTPARLSALSVIVFGGPSSLGTLATAQGVAGPTMTRIVDGLVTEGLARRAPDPRDGRVVLIESTPAGENLMRVAAGRRISAIATAIGNLPRPDQRRLTVAAGLLDEVAANVRELDRDRQPPGGSS
jgi:DNA-binding MarR family transcriptional regulator